MSKKKWIPVLVGLLFVGSFLLEEKQFFAFADNKAGPVDANVFVNLSKKMMPSVVNISSFTTVKSPSFGNSEDLFRRLFGDLFRQYNGRGGPGFGGPGRPGPEDEEEEEETPSPQRRGQKLPKSVSLGTGFVIDSQLILTNNHVVAGADEIKIFFTEAPDEKPSDAEVVGRDPEIDVALIRVKDKKDMVPVVFGDSDALEVGEYVMAVGNPFGQGHSVTHGIISAKGRSAPDFPLANYLQTDAPINPGNSGGPLSNLKGEVIGINNAIDQRAQGIGFAIPINIVKSVLPQLRSKGVVARGYIGVLVDQLTPEIAEKMKISKELQGPLVSHVYPGEPAAVAGMKAYDVILEVSGKAIHSSSDLIAAVTAVEVGQSVPVKVSRAGKVITLSVRVGQRPNADVSSGKTEKTGKKSSKKHIETGMTLENITPDIAREMAFSEKTGVVVSQVEYGGTADKAGLFRGDIILEVDRAPIKDLDSFYAHVKTKKSYLLRIRRADPQGREMFSVIVLDLSSKQ